MFVKLNLLQSINIIFFLFFKIFKEFFLNPLDIITSKKVLFNSIANFFEIIEFIAITPPKALTGSHIKAFLNDRRWFFSVETPHGFVCLIIAVPSFFLKELIIDSAE